MRKQLFSVAGAFVGSGLKHLLEQKCFYVARTFGAANRKQKIQIFRFSGAMIDVVGQTKLY